MSGRGRRGEDHDRANRRALRSQAGAVCRRYRLRGSSDAELIANREDGAHVHHRPVTNFLFLRYRLQSFKVGAEVPNQAWNDVRNLMPTHFLTDVWSEYGRGYSIYPKV
jgi:hypothetical protein